MAAKRAGCSCQQHVQNQQAQAAADQKECCANKASGHRQCGRDHQKSSCSCGGRKSKTETRLTIIFAFIILGLTLAEILLN